MKSEKPKVSVIVNCHNGEKYLKECIKSIINQTYKNLEIIFYDNFSNDKSVLIVRKFKDKRIKIFRSKSFLSLYDARNKAINFSTGKYIAFLDTDDWWLKNKIKEQINFLKKNDEFKIICTNIFLYNDGNKKKKKWHLNLPSGKITQKLLDNYSIGISSILIDKSIFKNNMFNRIYNIIGDYDLFIKLSISYKIASLNTPLTFYRIHDSNFSNKKLDIYYLELKSWLKKNERMFKRNKLRVTKVKYLLFKLRVKTIIRKLKLTF
ncbi:MAG: hypothetical protein CBC88_00365 [Candidatus Pelagibacter sp. TMED128]|nr:MAG: hypothetical protein CBC88_00365 [Candidatus Pelagibacter sp. TMED128]|tara:strand:+ start:1385 stop:2176 length:792 start_codon:yes stop_codon:yes gene_type:complete